MTRTLRTYARLDMSADPDSVIPIEQAELECEPLGQGAFEAALAEVAESTRHPARTFSAEADRSDTAPANRPSAFEAAQEAFDGLQLQNALASMGGVTFADAKRDRVLFSTIADVDVRGPHLPFAVRWAIDRARAEGLRIYEIAECQSFGEPGHIVHVLRSPGVCYLVVEDDHYGGGRPRLFHLADAVHLLQNVTEHEARAIVSRPPR